MTIHSQYEVTVYDTVGTGPYLFEWATSAESYVVCWLDNELLAQGDDYTVQLNTPSDGGSVTLLATPVAGLELLIARWTIMNQPLDLAAYTRFPSEANEAALDKLTLIVQEQQARINQIAEQLNQPVYSNVAGGVFVTTSG